MTVTLDLRIDEPNWERAIGDLDATCLRALSAAAAISEREGEVSLLLTGDAEITVLNRDWRDKDAPTDVLSFPAAAIDRPFLGDIAVSYGVAGKDAQTRAIALDQHLSHLLIHGFLHLIGYDHIEDTDANKMETLEVAALAMLGWPDPYR